MSPIRPDDYDFLSNKQSTFEEQENMTVVPNYDAPSVHVEWRFSRDEIRAVHDAVRNAADPTTLGRGLQALDHITGGIMQCEEEIAVLRSRLTAVEQERDEARTEAARWRELLELTVAARSSSDQEGR